MLITAGFCTVGGKKCGHSLTSRPRESASEGSLKLTVGTVFGYPSGSAAALLGGELLLRYCFGKFACQIPTLGLPARGHVQGLVAEFAGVEGCRGVVLLLMLSCLAWLVVLGCLVVGEFLVALKEFGYTGKPQHTLHDMAGMRILSLGQGSGRD